MENKQITSSDTHQIALSRKSIKELQGVQKWTMILSIGGMVMVSVVMVALLAIINYAPVEMENTRISLITNVIVMGVYLLPMYFLLRFALSVKKCINSKQEPLLSEAFSFLHIHYQILGIILFLASGAILLGVVFLLFTLTSGQLPGFS